MRMPALILILMAVVPLKAPAQDKVKIEESAKRIKELQKERIAALKEMVDQFTTLFKAARISFDELYEAHLLLLKAELESAEKESDRITLYKKFVDVLKGYEALAEERVRAARGTTAAVLKVKAQRLEAEIHLEQAKIKEAKGSK